MVAINFEMSRIGKLPVDIPSGVTVSLEDDVIAIKGPKGELTQKVSPLVKINVEDNVISVTQVEESRNSKAIFGIY